MHRVGDSIFNVNGKPGLVVDRHSVSGELTVNIDRPEVTKKYRNGYINGLSENERSEFNNILDEVKGVENLTDRVAIPKKKIGELSTEPKNRILAGYLSAELFHLMHSTGIQPKQYNTTPTGITRSHT